MTGDASAGAKDEPILTRRELEQHVADGLALIQYKLSESGRVSNSDVEKVRVRYAKALFYGANVGKQILETRELEDLSRRIDDLEKQRVRA